MMLTSAFALAAKEYVLSGSFGSQGGGNGDFSEPVGVAVNDSREPLLQPAAGDVYVADTGNNRVERFSAEGAYISQFDGSATPAKGFSFNFKTAIAVDNSTNALDLSLGDVYVQDNGNDVVDKFSASGEVYEGQLTGTCPSPGICSPSEVIPFTDLSGVAVDPSGNLWVYDNTADEASIDEFNSAGGFVKALTIPEGAREIGGLAVSSSSVYVMNANNAIVQLDSITGKRVAELASSEYLPTALAIDPSTDNLVVAQNSSSGARIAIFGRDLENQSSENPRQMFPEEGLEEARGLAVSGRGTVYVSQITHANVEIFDIPPVDTEPASSVGETDAMLNGSTNPEGAALTECYFEYGTELPYGQSVPCVEVPAGTGFVPVTAHVTGLLPRTTYHFRLNVNGAKGLSSGNDETLFTPSKPLIDEESVPTRGSTTVQATASINPSAQSTTYYVEYGATLSYGSATPESSVGAGSLSVPVKVSLAGLQPGSDYHARFVAKNVLGTAVGGDLPFTTAAVPGGSTSGLPDGRAYELVSTANETDIYAPIPSENQSDNTEIDSERPFRASADGDAIAYVGEPPSGGAGSGAQGNGLGNEYMATRTPEGWIGSDIYPPGTPFSARYVAFSSDLSRGVIGGLEPPTGAPCALYNLRSQDGVFHPFFTEQPAVSCGGDNRISYDPFVGASSDFTHLLFESQAALTPDAKEATQGRAHNLYESVNGQLQLVNVLPGPNPPADPNATFGGPHGPNNEIGNGGDFTNVISSDARRISWTDLNTHRLYLRESGTTTIAVSAGAAEYWTATPDGRYIFYTEGEESQSRLWRFDVDKFEKSRGSEAQALAEAREDLTGEEAGVLGVIGVNETGEDGAYVYFVAAGVLAANEAADGEKAMGGAPNLYLRSNGETTFLATLLPQDNRVNGINTDLGVEYGAWKRNLGNRTSEVTPDGQTISFVSRARLTAYDNAGCRFEEAEHIGCAEVYVYDSQTRQLSCASCDPTGAPAQGAGAQVPVTQTSGAGGGAYMERWLSDDGSRVFFDSLHPLLPQASNGRLNVYEWERNGAGSCRESAGCIYLLSGGSSPEDSYFVDASASGDDAFFTSRENLAAQAVGEKAKLYDARVGGGFPESTTACSGSGCQGVPPAPPVFSTPSSLTFDGAGNFPSSSPIVVKPKSAARLKAEKLSRSLKQCRKVRKKKNRIKCEKRARSKYGPATKVKKSNHGKGSK
ncbi:MAG TPA: NHL repeat-containing protein [Solirubrobacteraceae bacterium]|jgi:hypothetical protein